jgi:hypothetical protein
MIPYFGRFCIMESKNTQKPLMVDSHFGASFLMSSRKHPQPHNWSRLYIELEISHVIVCILVEHYAEARSLKKKSLHAPVPRGGSQCKYCSRIFPGRLGSHPIYCKKKASALPVDRVKTISYQLTFLIKSTAKWLPSLICLLGEFNRINMLQVL